jgi:hypothetical protein
VIENWPRVASKHLASVINEVTLGKYDFAEIEHLLTNKTAAPASASPSEMAKKKHVRPRR